MEADIQWFSKVHITIVLKTIPIYDPDSHKSVNQFWYIPAILKKSKNWSHNLLQNCQIFASLWFFGKTARFCFEMLRKLKWMFFDFEDFQKGQNQRVFYLNFFKIKSKTSLISKKIQEKLEQRFLDIQKFKNWVITYYERLDNCSKIDNGSMRE